MEPSEQPFFEAHMQQYMYSERARGVVPETFGAFEFGQGVIWAVGQVNINDVSVAPYRDPGYYAGNPSRNVTFAVINFRDPFWFMFNTYSHYQGYTGIDKLFANALNGTFDVAFSTDFILANEGLGSLERLRPLTTFVLPIVPRNNQTDMVGTVHISHFWDATVRETVPSVSADLRVIVTCYVNYDDGAGPPTAFTFLVSDGDLKEFEAGVHPPEKEFLREYRKTYADVAQGKPYSFIDKYSFTFYPTEDGYDKHRTSTPLAGAIAISVVVFLCGIFFLVYRLTAEREVRRQAALLETKKAFVRVISHEVRQYCSRYILVFVDFLLLSDPNST